MAQSQPSREFTLWVRSALAHIYDHSRLQNHPLVSMVVEDEEAEHLTRAQALRRVLLDCLEDLRPQEGAEAHEAARVYATLSYRYLDGLSIDEIADKLALSSRQIYREHGQGIRAMASLLAERVTSKNERLPTEDRLQVARQEVDRLRGSVHTETLELSDILMQIVQMMGSVLQQLPVQIHLSELKARPRVVADRVMLRQALLNLLSQQAELLEQGVLRIEIHQTEGNVMLEIRGEREGMALPAPLDAEETGINLTVAKQLIDAQGGSLTSLAREGTWGTRLTLPSTDQATILVVDDNADLISLLRRYLASHEVSMIGATDGEQALALATEMNPRLIILDIMMPSLDGWEVLQRLRALPATQETPIIICSVLNHGPMALAMGANDFIAKPVSQMDLLRSVRRWLGTLRPIA